MSAALRCLLLLALLFSLPRSGSALETFTTGEGGQLDWHGEGIAPIDIIAAVHRDFLNRRTRGRDSLVVGNAPGNLIGFDTADSPNAVHILRIGDGENIALGTIERRGSIRSPNVAFLPPGTLEELISDEPEGLLEAFERKSPENPLGIIIFLDLGARLGVEKIRFYPRNTMHSSPTTPFEIDFLRAFDLSVNDGITLTKSGSPIWGVPLVSEEDNQDAVVVVELDPPRVIRHIRLISRSPVDFEIDELEVIGKGFLPSARYISDIFDAGLPVVWGNLRWTETVIGDPRYSRLAIRTRTGSDSSYFVYNRKRVGDPLAPEIATSVQDPMREMDLAEYLGHWPQRDSRNRDWTAGSVTDDQVNWSGFSAPFPEHAANGPGLPVRSPSPRQYFQFQVDFLSSDLEATRVLRSVSLDLLRPSMADSLIAEIYPREVEVSEVASFTYAVRTCMRIDGVLGFDIIEVRTPARVHSIDAVSISDSNGEPVAAREFAGIDDPSTTAGIAILSVAEDRFSLSLPPVREDDTLILIQFSAEVLTYSTTFAGSVRLTDEPDIAQAVTSGDATSLGEDDDPDFSGTTVLSPLVLTGGQLLGQLFDDVELAPNPFTPNGDGVNDELSLRYSLLSLAAARPVGISVHDLSGRLVRVIHDGPERSGRYRDKTWDGLDAWGQLVPPGLYIVRISVAGDALAEEQARVVAVTY